MTEGLVCRVRGEHDCTDLHSWGPGVRDVYIFHYVSRGCGFIEVGGDKFSVVSGQIFVIFPNTCVKYYPDPTDPFHYHWIDFDGDLANKLFAQTTLSVKNPVSVILPDDVIECFKPCNDDGYEYSPSLLKLFGILIEKMPRKTQKKHNGSVEKAVEYIKNNLHKSSLCVADVANNCALSRSQLYRLFMQSFDCSPIDYIVNDRMNLAKSYLLDTDLNIKTVAFSVGYSDPLYFSNAFKKHFGVNPLQYRKRKDII